MIVFWLMRCDQVFLEVGLIVSCICSCVSPLVPSDGERAHYAPLSRRPVCFSINVFVQQANNRSLSLLASLGGDGEEEGTELQPLFTRSAKNYRSGVQSSLFLGNPVPWIACQEGHFRSKAGNAREMYPEFLIQLGGFCLVFFWWGVWGCEQHNFHIKEVCTHISGKGCYCISDTMTPTRRGVHDHRIVAGSLRYLTRNVNVTHLPLLPSVARALFLQQKR